MDAAVLQKPVAKSQSLWAVMIAADDKNWQLPFGQTTEKIVKQRNSLRRRHTLVIHVTCDQHGVRLLGVDNLQNLPQDILLFLQHGYLIDPLPDMQV